jgi:hypothetical protein
MDIEPCAPSEAGWYVEVIYDLPAGGQCDYSYDYFKGEKPTRAFAREQLVPPGNVLLECTISECPGRKGNYRA